MNKLADYIQKNNKTHLIFDFDETIGALILDWSKLREEVKKIAREYEPDSDYDFEISTAVIFNDYVKKYGAEIRDKFRDIGEQYETNNTSDFKVNDEVVDLIKSSSSKVMYVWSSNSRKTVIKYLEELGIKDYFEKIVTKDDVDFLKPNPQGFDFIYDGINPKEKYLLIGNSDADQQVAFEAGIDFYRV